MLTEQIEIYAKQALLDALSPSDCGPNVKVDIQWNDTVFVDCNIYGTKFQISSQSVDDPEDLKWIVHWKGVYYPMNELPCLLLETLASSISEMREDVKSMNDQLGAMYSRKSI